MHILSLPPEILHYLLYWSIVARSQLSHLWPPNRALRLRLVCRAFDRAFRPALFETEVLDSTWYCYKDHDCLLARALRSPSPSDILWHDYEVYRCRNERDASIGKYVEVRRIAYTLVPHVREEGREMDVDDITSELCWLNLGKLGGSDRAVSWSVELFVAATYLGCSKLVERFLGEGIDPDCLNHARQSPMFTAALTGQRELLRLLQQYKRPRAILFGEHGDDIYFLNPERALRGAIAADDLEMAKLAITGGDDETSGAGGKLPWIGGPEASDLFNCQSGAMAEYVRGLFADKITLNWGAGMLEQASLHGYIASAKYALEHGACIAGRDKSFDPTIPLAGAIRHGHDELVDLLLDHGADPNQMPEPGNRIPEPAWNWVDRDVKPSPLVSAIRLNSLTMVRKLLAAGLDPDTQGSRPLVEAVKQENIKMVELLMSVTTMKARMFDAAIESAAQHGLESMVDYMIEKKGEYLRDVAKVPGWRASAEACLKEAEDRREEKAAERVSGKEGERFVIKSGPGSDESRAINRLASIDTSGLFRAQTN